MKSSKRLQPLVGDKLICALMEFAAEGDEAAINCLDTLDETAISDDDLIGMYNRTEGKLHTL